MLELSFGTLLLSIILFLLLGAFGLSYLAAQLEKRSRYTWREDVKSLNQKTSHLSRSIVVIVFLFLIYALSNGPTIST